MHPLAAIVLGLAVGALAIWAVGGSVADTYTQMWNGAFGSAYFAGETLTRAIPVALAGLGVAVAFRSGFFNLGGEGQMVLGAMATALTALYLPGPGWLKLLAGLFAGAAAGALWSWFAGWLEVRFGIQLVISTLLFNYIADLFASYLAGGPFKDQTGQGALNQTPMIEPSARLPKLSATSDLHAGLFVVLAAVVAVWLWFRFTALGYELRMYGSNRAFGQYGGLRESRMMAWAMAVSGVLAGLAGAVMVLGFQYRFIDNSLTDPQYAWVGLMAALLANANPFGVAVASLLFAALQTGGMGVELNTNVPMQISSIIQYVVVLLVSVKVGHWWVRRRRRQTQA